MVRDTSIQAYRDIKSQLGARQRVVSDVINHLRAPTNLQINRYLGLPINTITPRTNELVAKGIVYDAGQIICPISGRLAHTWRVK